MIYIDSDVMDAWGVGISNSIVLDDTPGQWPVWPKASDPGIKSSPRDKGTDKVRNLIMISASLSKPPRVLPRVHNRALPRPSKHLG